jgi:hypothetical protein
MVAPEQHRPDPRHIAHPCQARLVASAGSVTGDHERPPAPDRRFTLHPRMPKSEAIARNVNRLRHPSRKTLGVAAASAAVAGVVAGAALSAGPANGATSALGTASHPAALSTPGRTAGANTLATSAKPIMNPGGAGGAAATHAGQAPARHVAVRDDDAVTSHPAGHEAATRHRAARAAATPAPRRSAPAHHAAAAYHAAPAHLAAAARPAVPAQPAQPYQFYDSVTPSAIPAGHEIATYADGPFAVSPSQVAGHKVLWIDTNGSDPSANALDVEPGDATPSQAATWAQQKLSSDPHTIAIIYTMQSEWQPTQAAIGTLPSWMQSHVRWWIADPTGVPHMVPGANATQWYWGQNYDISTANPGF